MQFYHEPDTCLFGGIFRVLARHEDRYEVELTDSGSNFIGRLKISSPYRERSTRVNFENHYPGFQVKELLREPYTGRTFPGYDDIDLSFAQLERFPALPSRYGFTGVPGHGSLSLKQE